MQAGAQAGAQADTKAAVKPGQAQASGSGAANGSAQAGPNNAAIAGGSAFNAELNHSLDSKKCKPGDSVTAHNTEAVKSDGKTVIPKGSKLVGHVTQAQSRANGESDSSLGIVFDKAILRNGQEVPLNVGIQALAVAQSASSAGPGGIDTMGGAMAGGGGSAGGGRSGGGLLGGATSSAGGAVGTVANTSAGAGGAATGAVGGAVNSTAHVAGSAGSAAGGTVGGLNAAGQLTSNSRGVFGLNGLNLSSAASNSTQGSLITSAGKNVHLDSGTRMLLVSQADAGAQPPQSKP
jgi:hypothetical protein